MNFRKEFARLFSCLTVTLFLLTVLPRPLLAEFIANDKLLVQSAPYSERGKVIEFMSRQEVQVALAGYGVSPDEARLRVNALSDAEVSRLAESIDTLPAGGDGLGAVIGAALLVFVILLLTDIFGLTKVFPFTRSVR